MTGAAWGYDWQLCDPAGTSCTTLAGEHAASLTLTPAMAGHTVRSMVTATTGSGSVSARSAASYPIVGTGTGTGAGAGGAGQVRDVAASPAAGAGGLGAVRMTVDDDADLPVAVSVTVHRVNGRGGNGTARVSAQQRGATITGRLLTAAGEPIGDAQIDVIAQRAIRGAHGEIAGAVRSDDDGRFVFSPSSGSGRRIYTFGYREHLSDDRYVHWVSVTVTPAPTLTVDHPTRVNGQSVLFRGNADDAVELQVRVGHRWKTIAMPALRDGSFSHRYRFTRTRTTHTYRFRARTPSGPSKTTTVRVSAKVEIDR